MKLRDVLSDVADCCQFPVAVRRHPSDAESATSSAVRSLQQCLWSCRCRNYRLCCQYLCLIVICLLVVLAVNSSLILVDCAVA